VTQTPTPFYQSLRPRFLSVHFFKKTTKTLVVSCFNRPFDDAQCKRNYYPNFFILVWFKRCDSFVYKK